MSVSENRHDKNELTLAACLSGHTFPGGVRCGSDDRLVPSSGDPGGACRLRGGARGGQVSAESLFHLLKIRYYQPLSLMNLAVGYRCENIPN